MNSQDKMNVTKVSGINSGRELHTHEFVELIFIAEGKCTHYVDDQVYEAVPGDLIFVNYGQTHRFVEESPILYYNLLYVPEFFSEELINSDNIYEIFAISLFREFEEKLPKRSPMQMVSFRGNEFSEIHKMVESMYAEFTQKEVGYRSVLNGYSRVLFSRILRKLNCEDERKDTKRCLNRLTEECLKYIDSKCFEKISLQEIAEKTFYNPSYLSRMFRQYCGISLSEYIKEKRIEEAKRLLLGTELSIEEIMNRVGYTDRKQFYKCFKEISGQTPAQFRKGV